MEYKGRLFGKVGKSYIPLTNTTADFKMLENRVRELEAENLKLRQSEHLHKHSVMQGLQDVTRVEVIDEKGRSYVNWNRSNKVELQIQDEGRTLKAFIVRSPTVGKAGEDASMSDGK